MRIAVIHGPNLNLLGEREPEIYGRLSLEEINRRIEALACELGVEVRISQSNHEGVIVDTIQECRHWADAIIINPGALTHYSFAVRDALSAVNLLAVEVHLSNIHAREHFRRVSVTAPATEAQATGFGPDVYFIALRWLKERLQTKAGE
jgi:3-dehydroquinate dehydratase-2